ncbi:MAG: hypothetical protein ACE5JX_06330 [Acidobacteriota bacterium]
MRASKGALLIAVLASWGSASGQSVWRVPRKNQDIQVDGFLKDWEGVPSLVLSPASPGVSVHGEFKDDDVQVGLRALWDKKSLYLAIDWVDDRWDIQQVRRRDAVFVAPDRRRRDRMYFFDNLRFHIQELNYDYLLWLSPRANDLGPYHWHRLLAGSRGMEAASASPVMTPRNHDSHVQLEVLFSWKQLRIKPQKRKKKGLPLELLLADSDSPGLILDQKSNRLKWLLWNGRMILSK